MRFVVHSDLGLKVKVMKREFAKGIGMLGMK